jgi:hypothetical protein
MEAVFPQLDLATAMAISAAAASPNMGTITSAPLVAIMTLFNVRLGYWVPNPGRLEVAWAKRTLALPAERREAELQELAERFDTDTSAVRTKLESLVREVDEAGGAPGKRKPPGLTFGEAFKEELQEVQKRWEQSYGSDRQGRQLTGVESPTPGHGLIGLAFSGGGIRSATINLGIAQVLHQRGVFDHVDYMSTVSGGGYLGASISTLMRKKSFLSKVDGRVYLGETKDGIQRVEVVSEKAGAWKYRVPCTIPLDVQDGQQVPRGRSLIKIQEPSAQRGNLRERFDWRVRPGAFLREMSSRLDETHKWVNVSDGGHIENLASIELLRRRCKFIIIGDGEADPNHHFHGLATLVRYARIDLGVQIDIDLEKLRLSGLETNVPVAVPEADRERRSLEHFAVGKIKYPKDGDVGAGDGYLLYLKSSLTGDEDEVITEYRHRNPAFPHESTADQFFDEGQFEAYRALGQHIAEQALKGAPEQLSFSDLEAWFSTLWESSKKA